MATSLTVTVLQSQAATTFPKTVREGIQDWIESLQILLSHEMQIKIEEWQKETSDISFDSTIRESQMLAANSFSFLMLEFVEPLLLSVGDAAASIWEEGERILKNILPSDINVEQFLEELRKSYEEQTSLVTAVHAIEAHATEQSALLVNCIQERLDQIAIVFKQLQQSFLDRQKERESGTALLHREISDLESRLQELVVGLEAHAGVISQVLQKTDAERQKLLESINHFKRSLGST